jgi:NAD(P)-dependent dehydrogenase (short-subunit alcohol dehydrogenase family)
MSGPVVLITGANKGLGLAALELLLERQPDWRYILGSRDLAAGETAASELRAKHGGSHVRVLRLDVVNDAHIADAFKVVENEYGKLDGELSLL